MFSQKEKNLREVQDFIKEKWKEVETEEYYLEDQKRRKKRKERVNKILKAVPSDLIGFPLLYGFIGWLLLGNGGCFIRNVYIAEGLNRMAYGIKAYTHEGFLGILIGFIIGVIIGIFNIKMKLK